MSHNANAFSEAEISLKVLRCTCAPGKMNHPDSACPNGRTEDMGIIGYWHESRIKRVLWAVKNRFKDSK